MGLSWDKTFVAGEGLRWKSRAKALVACLVTWRPNPGPLSCEPAMIEVWDLSLEHVPVLRCDSCLKMCWAFTLTDQQHSNHKLPVELLRHSGMPREKRFCNENHLNDPITVGEVNLAIKKLKTNKACGMDQMINKFFKGSSSLLAIPVTRICSLIFQNGFILNDWSLGIIKPIYKSKGTKTSPQNYRGITLLSCFGKLFTSVINNSLTLYIESQWSLGIGQAGFR